MKLTNKAIIISLVLVSTFLICRLTFALDLAIKPATVQRGVNQSFRIQIFANNATDIISMGIKVMYDPTVLQVTNASKNLNFIDGFIMDADGDPATEGDQYTTPDVNIDAINGSVEMLGGRITGASTSGMTGSVLLGWIDFLTVGSGSTYLSIDLAKYHPNHPSNTFANFVSLAGVVQDPDSTALPQNACWVYVGEDACEANLNGDDRINVTDLGILKSEFGKINCNEAGQLCVADLNYDGRVNVTDLGILKGEFGRVNCPTTTP